jgi:hypothetical protein
VKDPDPPGLPAGANPVYIGTDTTFEVRIEQIRPGWVHQGERPAAPDLAKESWARSTVDQLRGKELWLLTAIRSQDPEDPFGLSSKTYVSSTNIKMDSGSFGIVPLSEAERRVFRHDADMPYLVDFRLYEVDKIALKRELARVNRTEKGLGDMLLSVLGHLKGTLGSLVGERVTAMVKKASEEPLYFERLLLQAGGSLELQGSVLFAPTDAAKTRVENRKEKSCPLTRHFVLYDFYKSEGIKAGTDGALFNDMTSYLAAMDAQDAIRLDLSASAPPANASLEERNRLRRQTFLRFSVHEAIRPEPAGGQEAKMSLELEKLLKATRD